MLEVDRKVYEDEKEAIEGANSRSQDKSKEESEDDSEEDGGRSSTK